MFRLQPALRLWLIAAAALPALARATEPPSGSEWPPVPPVFETSTDGEVGAKEPEDPLAALQARVAELEEADSARDKADEKRKAAEAEKKAADLKRPTV